MAPRARYILELASRAAHKASRTIAPEGHTSLLHVRQAPATTTTIVVTAPTHTNATLSGGAIAGIVVGSLVVFLLLLWVVFSCSNLGAPRQQHEAWYDDIEPSHHRRSHRHRRHSPRRRRSRSTSYTYAVPTVTGPVPVVMRSSSRRRVSVPPAPPSPRTSRQTHTIEVDETTSARDYRPGTYRSYR